MANKPMRFEFEASSDRVRKDGSSEQKKKRISWDAIDVVAVFAGIVALLIVIGMLTGLVPIDKWTVALASLSGVGAVVGGARKSANKNTGRGGER